MTDQDWENSVETVFRAVNKDFELAFVNADTELLAKPLPERQAVYYAALQAHESGIVKRECENIMATLYREAALGDLSASERASKRYAVLMLSQLLKRFGVLAARAKPATFDAPIEERF